MLKARLALVAIPLLMCVAVDFFPFVLAYTQWLGRPAVATITDCHPGAKKQHCRGRWVIDGHPQSGEIDGVYPDDIGHAVRIRIGPLGAQKESLSGRITFSAMFLVIGLVAPVGGITIAMRRGRRARQEGTASLRALPPGATVLVTDGRRVWYPDGPEIMTVHTAESPAGYTPISAPGRVPRPRSGSLLEIVRWLAYNPGAERFLAVYGPDRALRFLLYRTPSRRHALECCLVDAEGRTQVVIRRTAETPITFTLLTPDGHELGGIRQADRWGATYHLFQEDGRRVGVITRRSPRTWIIASTDDATLPDVALAFAIDAQRLLL